MIVMGLIEVEKWRLFNTAIVASFSGARNFACPEA
jgi:hypothetical protein